jgi:hypothetical protein
MYISVPMVEDAQQKIIWKGVFATPLGEDFTVNLQLRWRTFPVMTVVPTMMTLSNVH